MQTVSLLCAGLWAGFFFAAWLFHRPEEEEPEGLTKWKLHHIDDLPTLTAAAISDTDDIRLVVDDVQGVSVTKQISLTEIGVALSMEAVISFVELVSPSSGDPRIVSVQTGDDRGLYIWTGSEAVLLTAYSEDGTWPVV